MSEKDLDKLLHAADQFWVDYSKLIAKHLDRLDPALHDYAKMLMQEKSSVYGSAYNKYLKKVRDDR